MPSEILAAAAATLAPLYGKCHGVLVASGMAALELALELAGVEAGDEVIVPADCCHRVPAAVCRHGAVPVWAAVGNDLQVAPERVEAQLSPRTAAIVVVHHLGLPAPVAAVRQRVPTSIPLIEDAAQALSLRSAGSAVGERSDWVVTSFAPGKPLDLEGGGGVFGDHPDLPMALEQGVEARGWATLPRSYPLHPSAVEGLAERLARAFQEIDRQRETVETVLPWLEDLGLMPWRPAPGDRPVYQRLPVRLANDEARRAVLAIPGADLAVQLPHTVPLTDLPAFRSLSRGDRAANPLSMVLLRSDRPAALATWVQELRTHGSRAQVAASPLA